MQPATLIILMNIISRMHAQYLLIGVNKEAVCWSIKKIHEGRPRVSVKPTKVSDIRISTL